MRGSLVAVMSFLANLWAMPTWSRRFSRPQNSNLSDRRSDLELGLWLAAAWSRSFQTGSPYLPPWRSKARMFWSAGSSFGDGDTGWATTVCGALGGDIIVLMTTTS